MNKAFLLLGQAPLEPSLPWRQVRSRVNEVVLLLGALALVVFILVTWAVFFRKREDDSASHHYSYDAPAKSSTPDGNNGNEGDEKPRKRRRWRRRRREHRPRNPTLAETGGLPPLRRSTPAKDLR